MSLKAGFKLCILGLVLLFLGLAVFIALLPFLISTDAIRLRLARDLSSMTGYNVQLREPPQISVFPSLRARLPHIVLTDNSPGNAPLMNAQEIIVHISLLDAVLGRTRFSETRLVSPHFTLSEPVKAASIFADFARSEGSFGHAVRETQDRLSESAETGRNSGAPLPLLLQPFGHIIIEDGVLTYPAPAPDRPAAAPQDDRPAAIAAPAARYYEIRNIEAEIDWPRHSRAATLTATGLWHGAASNLTIRADNALLLMSGGMSPLRVSFNSAKGGITFTGAAQAGQNFKASGQIAARSPGLDQTLAWLSLRLPFGSTITAPFIWEADLQADAERAALSNIVLTIGPDDSGNSGRGALEIGYQHSPPQISGSLAFEDLTVNLPASALFAETARPESGSRPLIDRPVFNLFGLDLRISADQALFNAIAVRNAAASIQMQKNGLIFDIGTMQIFDGTAQSSLRLKSDKDRLAGLEARFSTANINIAKLQQAFPFFGFDPPPALQLQGKANMNLSLQAVLPASPAGPPPELKRAPPAKNKKREPLRRGRPEEPSRQQPELPPLRPVLSYYSIFTQDIWPRAAGQLYITLNKGSLGDFAMADFISRVKAGQAFTLGDSAGKARPSLFKFDRLEGRFTLDKGALRPLSGAVIFGSHRLELRGEADIQANKLQIEGVFDPFRQSDRGQCADVQCLQQSLLPVLQFTAGGAPFSGALPAPAGKNNKEPEEAGPPPDNAVHIVPKVEILPH